MGWPKRYNSDAERQAARRVRRYAQGLNSQGKPYQRHPNFVSRVETWPIFLDRQKAGRRAQKLATNLASYERRAAANRAAGLRSDGKPFRRHTSAVDRGWQQLRSAMPATDRTSWDDIDFTLSR